MQNQAHNSPLRRESEVRKQLNDPVPLVDMFLDIDIEPPRADGSITDRLAEL